MSQLRVLDLFSGIGGFSLGLAMAGMNTIAFTEIDPFCRKVLRKHWPHVPICNDIHDLQYLREGDEPDDWLLIDGGIDSEIYRGPIDVICGGFPCQPYSDAGRKGGRDDVRALWPEMFRVIRQTKPLVVLGENVRGFVRMDYDAVRHDLESVGYRVQGFLIPACAVGAKQKRERCWIVAVSESVGVQGLGAMGLEVLGAHERAELSLCESKGKRHPPQCEVMPGVDGGTYGFPRWLDGFTYAGDPDIGGRPRVTLRTKDRAPRIKALGNAVVPQIPEMFGRALVHILNNRAAL